MNINEEQKKYHFGSGPTDEATAFDDATGLLLAEGLAPKGSLTSSPVWIVRRYFYDSGNMPSGSKMVTGFIFNNWGNIS